MGGAVAIGPLVGGVITEHLGWEWIFFVNVPIGLAAIALTELRLANVAAEYAERVDLPGLITFSLGLFLLIFGLIRGNPEGWGSALIVGSLAGSAAMLLAFVAVEMRSPHPMLDFRLFRKPAFNGVSAVAFCLSAGMFAMFLYLTLYIQGVLGYEPLQAGLRFLPMTVLSFVVAPIAGSLSHRIPIRVLLGVGLGLVGLGLLLDPRGLARLGLDRPARRVPRRRSGDRDGKPRHRTGGDRRRPRRALGDGLGDQHHLPAGRDRDRRRRAGGGLPVADRLPHRRDPAWRQARPGGDGRLGGDQGSRRFAPPGTRPPMGTPRRRPSSAPSTRSC